MKILIISPGKAHDHLFRDAIEEYEKRIVKPLSITWAFPAIGEKEEEASRILKLIASDDFVMLLDERGSDLSTASLAQFIEKHQNSGIKRMVFIIGGAFGVDEAVKARAQHTFKLSALIFPHMLVRLILVEQLYRAQSILLGGKYHHD